MPIEEQEQVMPVPMQAIMHHALQEMADVTFLALTIWRESRGQSRLCQVAVGYSILNRVARPSWWGTSLCEVLFKKWQYSSLTNPSDRQLSTWPLPRDRSWQQCLGVAAEVMSGTVENPVVGADSYYDLSIPEPSWATDSNFVKHIGRIRFHNVDMDFETEAIPKPTVPRTWTGLAK